MNMEKLQEQYRRFKQWQRQPIHYINSEAEHQCNNCGLTFTGNYCPCCSQQADLGRIGWRSVRQSLMDIWGLGTRSFLYSVWQLLLRPGYFMSDYISGKRQVSFPPVKMLFILAVAYALIFHWLFPDFQALGYGVDMKDLGYGVGQEMNDMFKPFYEWYESHFSWVMLILSFLAIFPTWVLFRYSPRHTQHTLPEGFFIQVLLANLQVVICLLMIPCWFFMDQMSIIVATCLIMMVYYIISYKQLFGYGLWGTLWRQAFVFGFVLCSAIVLASLIFDLNVPDGGSIPMSPDQVLTLKVIFVSVYGVLGILIMVTGYIINLIASRKTRKQLARLQQ